MAKKISEQSIPVKKYVSTLIKAAGFHTLPEEFQINYRIALQEQVTRRIGMTVMKELPEKKIEEFSVKFLKGKDVDQAAMQDFLKKSIGNFEEKIKKALDEFSAEFLIAAQKMNRDIKA